MLLANSRVSGMFYCALSLPLKKTKKVRLETALKA
jgi:hypothetical protein